MRAGETVETDSAILPTALAQADRLIARDRDGALAALPASLRGQHHRAEDRNHMSRLHEQDRPSMARAWAAATARPGEVATAHGWIRTDRNAWSYRRFDYCDLRHDPRIGVVLIGITVLRPATDQPSASDTTTELESTRWSILRLGALGRIQRAEGTLVELYGRTEAELIETNGLDLVHPDDHEQLLDAWADVVERGSQGRALRQRVVSSDGSVTWVLATIGRPDRDGSVTIHDLDISAQIGAEDALRSSEERFRNLAAQLPISVFVADTDGWLEFTNDTCRDLIGDSDTMQQFLGESSGWDSIVATAERDGAAEFSSTSDGRVLRIRCQRPLPDGTVSGVIEDVTTSTRWREEAVRDALTGLASRSAITRELDRRIAARQRSTVVFVDLDGFKRVNDEHGHEEGDRVLAQVGDALRGLVRDGDMAGRWGGDEFVLLVGDLPPDARTDLRRRVDAAMATCGAVGASVGFAGVLDHADVHSVIDAADQAMYADKRSTSR